MRAGLPISGNTEVLVKRHRQLEAEVKQNEVTQRVATKERDLAPHSPIPSLTFTELFTKPIRLPALAENYSFLHSFMVP